MLLPSSGFDRHWVEKKFHRFPCLTSTFMSVVLESSGERSWLWRFAVNLAPVPRKRDLNGEAYQGDLETIRAVLEQDALVHYIDQESKDSALRFAVFGRADRLQERKRIIELLVADGANINSRIRITADIPVMMAKEPEILEAMIVLGADRFSNYWCMGRIRTPGFVWLSMNTPITSRNGKIFAGKLTSRRELLRRSG